MDTLVWTIARGAQTASVTEVGDIEGDAELVAVLRQRLREPITVWRRGTVRSLEAGGAAPLELAPGDRRYVVARIRTLCTDDESFEIIDCAFR